MDISVKTTASQTGDKSWLGSAHGTESTESVTLDPARFTAGTHFPNGFVPAGFPIAKVTATGFYAPYADATEAGFPGTGILVGHLFDDTPIATAGPKVVAALLTHGKVREANLPANHGLDAAGKTDVVGRIRYL